MNNWQYDDKEVLTAPLGYFGFIYKISVIPTKDIPKQLHNKIYIGKKCFIFSKKKKLSKKARAGTRKRIERVTKDSNWSDYYGSSLALKADIALYGSQHFKREILCFCKNKTDLALSEVEQQIKYNVLRIDSYNAWISCKIWKTHLNK